MASAMNPQIAMSTGFTLYSTALASGITMPIKAPERLNAAAILFSRISAISRYGVIFT